MADNGETTGTSWREYRRLILAELKRLTQVTEKLRDQNLECKQEVTEEINKLRESIHQRITDEVKQLDEASDKDVANLKKEVDDLERRFNAYKKEQQKDTTTTGKWGFWAAVISIVGSLLVAVISLIIALSR